jgi:hypothetical protein
MIQPSVLFCGRIPRSKSISAFMPRNRVQHLPTVSGVELHIFAKKDWGSLIFIPVWLAFWTFGGITAMKWVICPGSSTPRGLISLWFMVVFLVAGRTVGNLLMAVGRLWEGDNHN